MRILKNKHERYLDRREAERAKTTLFLVELEETVDAFTEFVDDMAQTVGYSDDFKKRFIAHELVKVISVATSYPLAGKIANPVQYRRVIDKWNAVLAEAEKMFVEAEHAA